jgi:asparagine synthase (glutamine-hydrolysing)
VNGLNTKIVLKRLAERYAPKELIYRRKVGFNVPLSQWFRGPLRNLVEETLLSEQCLTRGYWKPEALRALVNGHIEGRVDREQGLWVLLVLELWHRLFVDDDGSEYAAERLRDALESSLSSATTVPSYN